MQFIVIGNIGSDAGYWIIGADGKPRHVGGWGVDRLAEVKAALSIIREATQLKTPGLAEAAIQSVQQFAEAELTQHIKDGGVIIVG